MMNDEELRQIGFEHNRRPIISYYSLEIIEGAKGLF
jgi:hypothetical protein